MREVLRIVGPFPAPPRKPEHDRNYVALMQLHYMAHANLKSAENAEYTAHKTKMRALKLFQELDIRRELLEESLGIEPKKSEGESE